ncbi:MAG: hypothetical protein LAT67_05045 [Balneolales bacterium]|nr:hypothetical protein [Balneolales bacterium]
MTHNIISYSIVGVWAKPISSIKSFSKKFCMELFDEPYKTEYGQTQDGFGIALMDGNIPIPSVEISNRRIVFVHRSMDDLIKLIDKVMVQLNSLYEDSNTFSLGAIGFNSEHEIIELEQAAVDLFKDKYITVSKSFRSGFQVSPNSVSFRIVKSNNNLINISIEPRANVEKGIFISANEHFNINTESLSSLDINKFPEKNDLERYYYESLSNFESEIIPAII